MHALYLQQFINTTIILNEMTYNTERYDIPYSYYSLQYNTIKNRIWYDRKMFKKDDMLESYRLLNRFLKLDSEVAFLVPVLDY